MIPSGETKEGARFAIPSWLWLLVLVPVLAIAFALSPLGNRGAAPRPVQGVLDLRGAETGSQVFRIDRGWAFYWQRFLEPEATAAGEVPPDAFVSLPDRWRNIRIDGQRLPMDGYATYRLKILPDPAAGPLALRVNVMRSAWRLWGNGRLLAESGTVAPRIEDEVVEQTMMQVALPVGAPVVDLVLHVSNLHAGLGSISTIRLGPAEEVSRWQIRRWVALFFVAGALMLAGVYHIAHHLLRPASRSALYFGLYCLLWMACMLCVETDWAIRLLFPELSADVLFRIYRFSMIAALAVSYQFFRSLYPQEFPAWIQRAIWSVAAVFMAMAVFAPVGVFVQMLPAYYPFCVAELFFSFWGLYRACRNRRDGAPMILAGQTVFGLIGLNGVLNDLGVVHSVSLFHFGVLIFVIAQSFALAQRFARLFTSVERLSEELTDKNVQLGKEAAERVRVQQDIVALSEAERSNISRELHDGLCQQLTGARLLCARIRKKSPADDARSDELSRLLGILDTSVEQAYDLSHGLWPVETGGGDLRQALGALAATRSETGGVPVTLEFSPHCERCRCANAAHVHSIAREAVVNATKHARAQGIVVRLDCHEGTRTTLTVADDGIGAQVQPERRAHNRGGLGLRIMAYRARMVGGSFRVEASPEGGTRVVATLPCHTGRNAPEHSEASA